ncbi:hypothetical protein ANCCEY_02218 [Ancylostoma ceylanicum]|uniref:SCP domain-containing protein n=1 Tax=Ancylostoma ceylanicum TaxID=53326 RepID=A0A0D6M3I6_9BILA|nr:hypothetical protein ANCCEY_02218 [Ancylostoma ceylanicum]
MPLGRLCSGLSMIPANPTRTTPLWFPKYSSLWKERLKWDCNLEEMAHDGTLGNCTLPGDMAFNPYHSMQMATGNTTGFGCTYALCNDKPKGVFVCVYDDKKLLASGWAKDKKSESGYAPTAKKMLALTYDCDPAGNNGAKETYALIDSCPRKDPQPTNGYSLNFLRLKNYTVSEQDALKHAIKTWWGELEKTGLGSDTTFKENSGITSFANMAHDETDKVACAVKNCKQNGDTLVACQYSQ